MSAVVNTIDHDGDGQTNIDHQMNDQGVNEVNWRLTCLKDFQKLNPPNFAGTTEPLEAESWLKQVKKKLDVLRIPEDFRVEFAAYLFIGEADHWWDYIKRTDNVATMTWVNFEKTFYGKYFPQTIRNAKLKEFVELIQGDLTVTQYEAKFTQLSRYAPLLVANEENKTNRFADGLIRPIRKMVVALGLTTYKEAVAAALRIEQEHNDHMAKQAKNKASSNSGRKITRRTDYGGQKGGNKGGSSNSTFRNPRPSPYPCYKCGQLGHIQRFCPQNQSPQISGGSSQQQIVSQPHQSFFSPQTSQQRQASSQIFQPQGSRGRGKDNRPQGRAFNVTRTESVGQTSHAVVEDKEEKDKGTTEQVDKHHGS